MDTYSTATLLATVRNQKLITPFWLGFFNSQINFETEEIFFDRVNADYRYMAPLVVPNVQGRVMSYTGFDSVSFKPAYVKPKHVIDPNMVIKRRPGEAVTVGSMSLEERHAAVVADLMFTHTQLHQNRQEWLAAKAVIDGGVLLASADYPSTYVDFRRDPSLSITLTGGAAWSASTGNPLGDIKAARKAVKNLTGAKVTKIVFGADAWDMLNMRVDLRQLMNRFYGGSETNITLMDDGFDGQEYMGTIAGLNGAGRIEVWVDTSKYKDEAGAEQFFLDQSTIVGVGDDIGGVRCFGAIKDFRRLAAVEMFPKIYQEEDPSVEYLLSQSAPLMVPKVPNSTFKIKVAATA